MRKCMTLGALRLGEHIDAGLVRAFDESRKQFIIYIGAELEVSHSIAHAPFLLESLCLLQNEARDTLLYGFERYGRKLVFFFLHYDIVFVGNPVHMVQVAFGRDVYLLNPRNVQNIFSEQLAIC